MGREMRYREQMMAEAQAMLDDFSALPAIRPSQRDCRGAFCSEETPANAAIRSICRSH